MASHLHITDLSMIAVGDIVTVKDSPSFDWNAHTLEMGDVILVCGFDEMRVFVLAHGEYDWVSISFINNHVVKL